VLVAISIGGACRQFEFALPIRTGFLVGGVHGRLALAANMVAGLRHVGVMGTLVYGHPAHQERPHLKELARPRAKPLRPHLDPYLHYDEQAAFLLKSREDRDHQTRTGNHIQSASGASSETDRKLPLMPAVTESTLARIVSPSSASGVVSM
jgi:hypothetical protein